MCYKIIDNEVKDIISRFKQISIIQSLLIFIIDYTNM